jgi:concanavalin A-like lectin/glucanase superfamily protein/cellulose/xylan binding protein with CBM9 domain
MSILNTKCEILRFALFLINKKGNIMKIVFGAFVIFILQFNATASTIKSTNQKTMSSDTKKLYNNWQSLKKRKLRLLPVPKKIDFIKKIVNAENIVIVIDGVDDKNARIAVNEIVSRIKELSGRKVPVVKSVQKNKYNLIIENKYPNFFTKSEKQKVNTENPFCRKQAYGISTFENGLRMAGNSPLATVYAAVTVRYLIERKADEVLLYPADIIDWPDFPRRLLTGFMAPYHYKYRNNPAKHLANMKKYVDWALRLKCNMVFRQTYTPYNKISSPLNDVALGNETLYKSGSAVGQYMKERGISALAGMDVALGYAAEKDRPEVKEMFYNRIHKRYYSWANSKLHKIKAQRHAETFGKLGYSSVFVHAIDGGSLNDPEYWSMRDKLTRDKYGDDRVQADVDMFTIYLDAMKKHGIETQLVIYPYTASNLDIVAGLKSLGLSNTPANRKMIKNKIDKLKKFMIELNQKIPRDVPVCVRENKKDFLSKYYKNYSGRPILIYYEVLHFFRDIYSLLPQEINTFTSAYDPKRKQNDIIWLNMHRKFLEQASVCGAEYAWNTQFPGTAELDRTRNPVNYDDNVLGIMAERAAVGLWGDEAGQDLKKLFDKQLSFYLAYAPKVTTKSMNLKSILPLLHNNYIAAIEAEKAMDKVWNKVKKNKKLIDNFSYPLFVIYYKMLKAARVYTAVNYYAALGYERARIGDMKGVDNAIAQGKKEFAASKANYTKSINELRNEPALIKFEDLKGWWRMPPVNTDSNLLGPDFATLEKKLLELKANSATIFQQYNIPSWFKTFIKRKSLIALSSNEIIKNDGKVDEDIWKSAVPVEHFIHSKNIKLPVNSIVVKLLYDKKNIYMSGKISQPLMSKIKYSGKGQCDFSESIELFIQPDKNDKSKYFQFALDAWGHLFTLKKDGEGLKESKKINWNSGAEFNSIRTSKGWSFELTIPFANLKRKSGAKLATIICYNGVEKLSPRKVVESYASNNVEGKGFHNPDKFQRLLFFSRPVPSPANVNMLCLNTSIKGVTHESGTGSHVKFDAMLESRRPLYDVKITARFLDKNKQSIGQEMLMMNKKYLPLSWRNSSPLHKQLLMVYKGIYIQLTVKYKTLEGKEGKLTKNFIVGSRDYILKQDNPYEAGVNGKGITAAFYSDIVLNGKKLLSPEAGCIEFWFKPDFKPYNRSLSVDERQVLFHCGPIRRKHPMHFNKSAVTAMFVPRYGSINFQIASEKFKPRNTYAYIRNWKKGQWHHLAFVWNLKNKPCYLDIYIDGKLASKTPKKAIEPLANKSPEYPIQFGAMNSGSWILKGTLDELKISTKPEYKDNFTPAKKASGKGTIFHFENKLNASSPVGLDAQQGVLMK